MDTGAGSAGLGAVTVVQGASFCISSHSGDIQPGQPQGVFYQDTRIISRWRLTIDGHPLEPLSARTEEPFRAVFLGRAQHIDGRADNPLVVEHERHIGAGLLDEIGVRNYSRSHADFVLTVTLDADFADLFDVKGGRHVTPVHLTRTVSEGELRIEAVRRVHKRSVVIQAPGADIDEHTLTFHVSIPARGRWSTTIIVTPLVQDKKPAEPFSHEKKVLEREAVRRHEAWEEYVPQLTLDDKAVQAVLGRSSEDLGGLRIFDPDHPDRVVVAAGAPWFMALFGRDSLLSSYMALAIDPSLATGTLQTLAEMQGEKVDNASEEEPGRILHEVRLGLDAGVTLGEGKAYYGTADATPLFVAVLGELNRWGLAEETRRALLPHADRALDWIREYGDRDGDGFVEYLRANEHGLVNQGWKDSWDGINFADGTLAEPPIALSEVQGYVYAAYISRGLLAQTEGDTALATEWADRAAAFKEKFNKDFWMEDKGCFATALDKDKRQVDSCASNIGHCLWTGLVDEDKAGSVAAMLMSPQMFTGWGVRTLASNMGAYNPVSYHNGSVWPHDNALIAAGLMRYGFVEEASKIATGLFAAATHFDGQLPELFCGFDRETYGEPVPYPTSCSPQAWASAAPIQLIRSLLRLDPLLTHHEVWLAPVLPREFGDFRADNLLLAHSRLCLSVSKGQLNVEGLPPGVALRHEPRPALPKVLATDSGGGTGARTGGR